MSFDPAIFRMTSKRISEKARERLIEVGFDTPSIQRNASNFFIPSDDIPKPKPGVYVPTGIYLRPESNLYNVIDGQIIPYLRSLLLEKQKVPEGNKTIGWMVPSDWHLTICNHQHYSQTPNPQPLSFDNSEFHDRTQRAIEILKGTTVIPLNFEEVVITSDGAITLRAYPTDTTLEYIREKFICEMKSLICQHQPRNIAFITLARILDPSLSPKPAILANKKFRDTFWGQWCFGELWVGTVPNPITLRK